MRSKVIYGVIFILALSTGMASAAGEEKWPTKPIELYIGFPPGGPSDNIARIYAPIMSKELGVPVVIINKPGASGALAAEYVAKAKPDGYTIMETSFAVVSQRPNTHHVTFSVDDFTIIGSHSMSSWCLLVKKDAPWKDYRAFLEHARKVQGLNYGIAGAYNAGHVVMQWISRREGINFTHVVFTGLGDSLPAMLGGHVDSIVSSGGHAPMVEGGKIKTLLQFSGEVSDATKVPYLTDVYPDFPESLRYAPEMPKGVTGPKGIPVTVVNKLANALRKATQSDELKRYAKQENLKIVDWDSAKIYKAVQIDFKGFGQALKEMGYVKEK